MLQNNCRVEVDEGIKFYEQDILFDDYIYIGNTNIEVTIDYANPGFGIALINSESNYLSQKNEILMFKLGNKSLDIIYRNKDQEDTLKNPIKGSLNASEANCFYENLKFKIVKIKNKYTIYINDEKIGIFNSTCDLESFNLGYYSNKDNVIKDINIASSIPYDWIVNMKNTNGGYVRFDKDGFKLLNCKNNAELEQLNIELTAGTYYLKFNKSNDCDIKTYVMLSDDKRIKDEDKNILNNQRSFTLKNDGKVSLKFVGRIGEIHNICITSLKDNEYINTSPETGSFVKIEESYIKFNLKEISKLEFIGIVNFAPGDTHYNPIDYSIIKIKEKRYGLDNLKISEGVEYKYIYEKNLLRVLTLHDLELFNIDIDESNIVVFDNVNGIIKNLILTDNEGNDTNMNVQLTTKKSVPGLIKSPIIVLDSFNQPLELSSSFRISTKNNNKYYLFTNVEREYFLPKNHIKLNSIPLNIKGSAIIYGIPKNAEFDLDKIYYIEKDKDNIDLCCNFYDVLFDGFEYGVNINYATGEIDILNINDYKYLIVDYLKDNSYCINYKYELNSYEVDISTTDEEGINVIYDNTEKTYNSYEYINEKLYYNTNIIPETNCYIVLGR